MITKLPDHIYNSLELSHNIISCIGLISILILSLSVSHLHHTHTHTCTCTSNILQSACSVTCGRGFQTQTIFCLANDTGLPLKDGFCDIRARPKEHVECSNQVNCCGMFHILLTLFSLSLLLYCTLFL